jgi:uncharacterized protein (TIGR02246 family)
MTSISTYRRLLQALVLLCLLVPAALQAAEPVAQTAQISALLRMQAEAWSRGDLEAFTSVYAEDAAFLSPTGLTRGRREVLERYRRRYPDAAAMGKLTLEVLETRLFTAGSASGQAAGASVAARWRLEYPGQADRKAAEGLTLIVLRRTATSWEIVQDASM